MKKILLIIYCFITSFNSFCQAALVKDIGQGNEASHPSKGTLFNGILYFSANDGVHGRELWKTDGTEAGTVMFKEFAVGLDNGIAKNFKGLVINGVLYFLAWDGTTFNALWKTDGTDAGTVKIKNFPYVAQSADLKAVNLNDNLIISVEKPGYNQSTLWISDGTTAGTILLKDTKTAAQLILMNNEVFFEGDIDDGKGTELWKTDGTATGTVLVKDINPNGWGANIKDFRIINGNTLIFFANDGVHGIEFWKSDGTDVGTVMVTDLASGAFSIYPKKITVFNNKVYFGLKLNSAFSLWETDGTAAGTQEVKNDIGEQRIVKMIVNNNHLYIFKRENYFWKSDGTTTGTIKINTTYNAILAGRVTNIGTKIFFTAVTDMFGLQLWKTDGTAVGTQMIKEVSPRNAAIGNIKEYNGQAIFTGGLTSYENMELWKSDGTEEGTAMIKDINQTGNRGADIKQMIAFNNKIYFSANNYTNGKELWSTDGVTTSLLKDINPEKRYSSPNNMVEMNGSFYFYADNFTNGSELWKTDGTAVGTQMVKDINPNKVSSLPFVYNSNFGSPNIVLLNNELYFFAFDGVHGTELWKSDGTETGTVMVKDINPGDMNSLFTGKLTVLNNKIFFAANNDNSDIEIWVSDGTTSGTQMLKNINENGSSKPYRFIVFNNELYFIANDGVHGEELWKTNGTEVGTIMVKDINVGNESGAFFFSNFTVVENEMFFKAIDGYGISGLELWKTDGTEAGTVMVKDIYIGTGSSYPEVLVEHKGLLYFLADDGTNGRELWKSDGTDVGTVLVKDAFAGSDSSVITEIISFGGKLIYSNSSDGQNELWISDGTDTGTVLFQEINPSATVGSSPQDFYISGATLYFTADDGTHGRELYKLDESALAVDKVSKELAKVRAFPNPTNGVVSLNITNQQIQSVKVYSLFGKEVMRISSENNNQIEHINLQNLATGMYLIKIKTATLTFTRKIMKQ